MQRDKNRFANQISVIWYIWRCFDIRRNEWLTFYVLVWNQSISPNGGRLMRGHKDLNMSATIDNSSELCGELC